MFDFLSGVTAKGTGPQGRIQCGLDSTHRRPCGTCLEVIRQGNFDNACLSILRMTLTVALLCAVQGSNNNMFVLDTYTARKLCTILFRTDEIL